MAAADSGKRETLWGIVAAIAIVLMTYSQTIAITWDEGFHLLAAQLIDAGKRPYVDFMFGQTPLNAYWVAFWMRLFGQTWHVAHALATIETAAAVALAGDYVYRRFPEPAWRLEAAIVTAVLFGFNVVVVEYGTLGQAYGICLLLAVAAFRFAVMAPDRRSILWPFLAGLATGGAAASSLLTIMGGPVLLIWFWRENRAGSRWTKLAAFVAGIIVPFAPMLRLLALAPNQVLFDVFKFHIFYRQNWWDKWQLHDIEVASSWLDSTQALILGALAIGGLVYVWSSGWARDVRAEFLLSGWMAVATGAYLMTTHPTFQRYFLLAVPFLAIPAAAGVFAALHRAAIPLRANWPVTMLVVLTAAGLARSVYEDHEDSWYRIEGVAQKVREVTPPGGKLYAEDPIYFAMHWTPPPGFEWNGSHKVDMAVAEAAKLHIVPRAEVIRLIKADEFDTVETCGEGEPEELGLYSVYAKNIEVDSCKIFWQRKSGAK